MTDSKKLSDIVNLQDSKFKESVFDENFKFSEEQLMQAKKLLEEAEYLEKITEIFSNHPDVYQVDGESRVYFVCPEKLNITDFSVEKAGLRTGNTEYRTFPSVHYFKRKSWAHGDDHSPDAEGVMLIGRQVAMVNVYPHRIFIDDASVFFTSKPAGNSNKAFAINKELPNYIGKFDEKDEQFKKTISFARSLDERNPNNTPLWLQNYLILQ